MDTPDVSNKGVQGLQKKSNVPSTSCQTMGDDEASDSIERYLPHYCKEDTSFQEATAEHVTEEDKLFNSHEEFLVWRTSRVCSAEGGFCSPAANLRDDTDTAVLGCDASCQDPSEEVPPRKSHGVRMPRGYSLTGEARKVSSDVVSSSLRQPASLTTPSEKLIDVLYGFAFADPSRQLYDWLDDKGEIVNSFSRGELWNRGRVLADRLQRDGIKRGDFVMIVYP